MKHPGFSLSAIWERDRGICQYTGKVLKPGEGNIDHVVPKAQGGGTTWKNCVLSSMEVNSSKGNRLPKDANLKLIRPPEKPKAVPVTAYIKNTLGIKDWDLFLT